MVNFRSKQQFSAACIVSINILLKQSSVKIYCRKEWGTLPSLSILLDNLFEDTIKHYCALNAKLGHMLSL